jgi:hypothetical protein
MQYQQQTGVLFYSEANLKHLFKAIVEFDNPDSPRIVKAMEELEAMANE